MSVKIAARPTEELRSALVYLRDLILARRVKEGPLPGIIDTDLADAHRAGPPRRMVLEQGDAVRWVGLQDEHYPPPPRQIPKGYVTRSGEERAR